jgi:hypothetical protein
VARILDQIVPFAADPLSGREQSAHVSFEQDQAQEFGYQENVMWL